MNKNTDNATDIRRKVSEDYARDVTSPGPNSCCQTTPKGVAASLAGYSATEVAEIPREAAVNSFGCGNPLALAEVKEGQTVLDLGSGAGIDLFIAAKKVGPKGRVIGVDMTDAMISKANENIAASGYKNIEVRKGIIEDLPVEASSVDWVISNCVINLSPEKEKVFMEIARVLKPGGSVSVSDIVAENLPAAVKSNRMVYSSCVAGAISEKDYVRGMEQAGLSDVRVTERFVYEKSQLAALIGSEIRDEGCCGTKTSDGIGSEWAEKLEGKVWSARIVAKKDAGR